MVSKIMKNYLLTFWNNFKKYKLLSLFLIALFFHLIALTLVNCLDISSKLGGVSDSILYHKSASIIAEQFRQGNFSIENIKSLYPNVYLYHSYTIIIAVIYAVFGSNILIGELLNVFFCALISVFVYLIIIELGGQKDKWAFLTGIIVAVYPSLALNGSLLLKDALQVCLTMAALFFAIKVIKNFNIRDFLIFYALLFPLTNLRFYCGYAVMLAFGICWLLFAKSINIKKRVIYMIVMIILFGFVPMLSTNYGYFGINSFGYYLNKDMINDYRHAVTSTNASNGSDLGVKISFDSPVAFIVSYLEGFVYVLLGPLLWQLKYVRHFLTLFEMIPWYFMLYFIIRGMVKCIRDKKYQSYILIIFAVIFLMALALFDSSNFGLFMRIRIPAFICLLCFLPFGVNDNLINKLKTKLKWLNI
jgi:hypothetical protein